MKCQTCGQLHDAQTGKIWCKNIHAFLRNYSFRVGGFILTHFVVYVLFFNITRGNSWCNWTWNVG